MYEYTKEVINYHPLKLITGKSKIDGFILMKVYA